MIDIAEIRRLIELVEASSISEVTLRNGAERITIKRRLAEHIEVRAPGSDLASQAWESDAELAQAELRVEEALLPVEAPVVGVFRHVKPMIGLGATVDRNQVVGMIEAMKLMNEVTSPAQGRVVEVVVEDGQPVEYGQELFILDRAAVPDESD